RHLPLFRRAALAAGGRARACVGQLWTNSRQRRRVWDAAGFGDQAGAGGLDAVLDQGAGLGTRQARRDGIEHLDDDGAGVADDAAARPEQAGVERERVAGQAQSLVERDEARLVVRRRARRPSRAFREDDDLALLAGALAGVADQALERAGAAVPAD